VERYTNQLLDSWVGQKVFASCLAHPGLSEEFLRRVQEEPRSIRQELLHSMIGLYMLEGYDQVGVTLAIIYNEDDRFTVFVPWGAVIRLERAE
jgi:hypothetical protein